MITVREKVMDFQVKDFMSKNVLGVSSKATVKEAVRVMIEHEVGGVVVLTDDKPVGIFAERDLMKVLANAKDPEELLVKEAMSSVITKISPDQGSKAAAKKMTDSKGRLLVFEDGNLVGIVTATDMVRVIYRTGIVLDVDEVISRQVITADMGTQLRFVIRQMDKSRVGSVIVTQNKAPFGIFTERDLLNKVVFLDFGLDEAVVSATTVPLVTAELGIDGRDIAGAMVSRHIKRLPLMEKGKIAGIITARDLVQAYAYPYGKADNELARQVKIRYGELCPLCNTRIDEAGLCACGAGGE